LPKLEALGCTPTIREKDGQPFYTDENNLVIDCAFEKIDDPEELAQTLSLMPGVVEHGLFIDNADIVLIGTDDGIKKFER
jgi:ribose 5-phosphate isomerase A